MADFDPSSGPPSNKPASFRGDVLRLVSGTSIAQIASILASPVLARLFAPEAFGIFALFSSVIGILAAVFTLEYELAVMLPQDDADAANLLMGTMGISSLFSLLTVPLVWLAGPALAQLLNAPSLAYYLWLIPPLLLFGGIAPGHPALNVWAGRTRRFTQISITRVTGTVTSTLAKLAAGFAGFNSGGGLIGGSLIGSIVTPLMLGWQIWREDSRLFLKTVRFSRIWENLKRYRKFAIYNTPSALMNAVSWQAPSFLLSAFFSTSTVGFFAFSNQLLGVPMNLIGASISQAFFSHAAVADQRGELAPLVESTFRRLVEYSFFPILILAVIGKELFLLVFGPPWTEAGVYTQILSLWVVFWFVSSPMAQLVNILEKNEFFFGWNVAAAGSRALSIWLGAVLGSPRLALMFYSISGALVYGYLTFWILRKAGCSWHRIRGTLLQNLVIFAAGGGILLVLEAVQPLAWVPVIAAAFLICIYYGYRLKDEPRIRSSLLRIGGLFGKFDQ